MLTTTTSALKARGRSRPLQSAILPPRRPDLTGRSAEEIGLDIKEVTRSIRDAWRALRLDNFKRMEAERLPVAASLEPGDKVLIVYGRGSERTSKHSYRAHGLARGCDAAGIVRLDETGTERKVPWHVLDRYFARAAKRVAPGGVGIGVQELAAQLLRQQALLMGAGPSRRSLLRPVLHAVRTT